MNSRASGIWTKAIIFSTLPLLLCVCHPCLTYSTATNKLRCTTDEGYSTAKLPILVSISIAGERYGPELLPPGYLPCWEGRTNLTYRLLN